MTAISLRSRDVETLRLLSWTQLTAALLLKASGSFALSEGEEAFTSERRVRERLQALSRAGLVRASPLGVLDGGVANWYRLTSEGFRAAFGPHHPIPPKTLLEPIKVSRQEHTSRLAEAIVHWKVACRQGRIRISDFRRENELEIAAGGRIQYPDMFMRCEASGRRFNFMLEIDNGTEPIDSTSPHSIREKLLTYEAHQDDVLRWWHGSGRPAEHNPRFRVVFLTRTPLRAQNILALARKVARNPDRLLCYAASWDDFLREEDALRQPLCLDHHGRWQMLIDNYPSSRVLRSPVRLAEQ